MKLSPRISLILTLCVGNAWVRYGTALEISSPNLHQLPDNRSSTVSRDELSPDTDLLRGGESVTEKDGNSLINNTHSSDVTEDIVAQWKDCLHKCCQAGGEVLLTVPSVPGQQQTRRLGDYFLMPFTLDDLFCVTLTVCVASYERLSLEAASVLNISPNSTLTNTFSQTLFTNRVNQVVPDKIGESLEGEANDRVEPQRNLTEGLDHNCFLQHNDDQLIRFVYKTLPHLDGDVNQSSLKTEFTVDPGDINTTQDRRFINAEGRARCLHRLFQLTEYDPQTYAITKCLPPPFPLNATETEGESSGTGHYIIKIFFGLFTLSTLCLLFTVAVYVVLWREHNIHGWTILAFSLTKFTFFLSWTLALRNILFHKNQLESPFCVVTAVSIHFFGIATYSWLNVLTFDLLVTVRSMVPLSERSKGRRRFAVYCAYGLGIPSIVVGISWIIEKRFETILTPGYGRNNCFFGSDLPSNGFSSSFYYMTLVILVLYLLNMIFVVMVVRSLVSATRGSRRMDGRSNSALTRNQAILVGKLVIITGIPWSLDFVFEFLSGGVVDWLAASVNVVLAFEGMAIFWVFVCQKKMWQKLCTKFRCLQTTNEEVNGRGPRNSLPTPDNPSARPTYSATSAV